MNWNFLIFNGRPEQTEEIYFFALIPFNESENSWVDLGLQIPFNDNFCLSCEKNREKARKGSKSTKFMSYLRSDVDVHAATLSSWTRAREFLQNSWQNRSTEQLMFEVSRDCCTMSFQFHLISPSEGIKWNKRVFTHKILKPSNQEMTKQGRKSIDNSTSADKFYYFKEMLTNKN